MKKIILFITTLFLSYSAIFSQGVSAYQAGSYQPALMNVRDLATLGPGLVFIDYNYWNNSNGFYDKSGNKVSSLELELSPIDPGFGKTILDLDQQISGYINVPVLFYAAKFKILGARYMASLNPVFLTSNYKININVSETGDQVTSTGNTGGMGDLAIMPFGLGWAFEKMDFSFFYTMYTPTGRYETGGDDNIGKGYWTHQFQLPTYFYFKEKTTALFVMPTFEANGTVKGSDVRPGSRFTIEYGISHYVTSWLELEILNGHNWQIGDDKGNDVWWRDTPLFFKDQTSSVSFGAGVWPWAGRLNVRAKYAIDYGTKQRYKSNFLSFSAIFIPNLLTK